MVTPRSAEVIGDSSAFKISVAETSRKSSSDEFAASPQRTANSGGGSRRRRKGRDLARAQRTLRARDRSNKLRRYGTKTNPQMGAIYIFRSKLQWLGEAEAASPEEAII